MKKDPSEIPFSYPVKVGHISANPVEVRVSADKDELKALAESWNVVSVDNLRADLQINRWKRDGIRHPRARRIRNRRDLRADLRA
jgi:hypothetical protein